MYVELAVTTVQIWKKHLMYCSKTILESNLSFTNDEEATVDYAIRDSSEPYASVSVS